MLISKCYAFRNLPGNYTQILYDALHLFRSGNSDNGRFACDLKISMDNLYWSGDQTLQVLASFLKDEATRFSSVVVLCDDNTLEHCFPLLEQSGINVSRTIVVGAGERHKELHTLTHVWTQLLGSGADRSTLLINLGGGMVTDLGGFAASTYMRGIRFVHMPTTLLGMVDAAIGGKTGIDFGGAKNMVGTFALPELILSHLPFLETLPEKEWRNGYAEMIKHELIGNAVAWDETTKLLSTVPADQQLRNHFRMRIDASAAIKHKFVTADPNEQGIRAALNFGHTIGHAIESWSVENRATPLSHGEAVAAGMICEAFLSEKLCGFPASSVTEVVNVVDRLFVHQSFSRAERGHILEKIRFDKKRKSGGIRMSLLSAPGVPAIDIGCTSEQVAASLHFYAS